MTNEEIILLAEGAGFFVKENEAYSPSSQEDHELTPHLESFANLVAEYERKKYTKLYEEEIRSIKEAATQYGIPSEDAAGMLLFCEEFARMIAEKEREACAKVAEEPWQGSPKGIAEQIRAMGQE